MMQRSVLLRTLRNREGTRAVFYADAIAQPD
jgi:hypothetical protein